ncbi:uncharacterized protein NPIL_428131 [Nephila pilipes]|uniref:Uncharacterized protein n=1 Tax=Nephila pilipes TaxID=299642 RepID=A0A8X6TKJ6_NEPPI|nr:uncharacterized protein NPIL_428131 [Nephila pilipes]
MTLHCILSYSFNKDILGRDMLFIYVLLIAFAFASAYRDDRSNSYKYVDEVLSEYLPREIKNGSLDPYEMPDFRFNVKNSSAEGEVYLGKVKFYLGNLTGLNVANKKSCQLLSSLSRTSVTNRIICTIVLPRVKVIYRGRYEATTGYTSYNGDRIQQRDIYGEIVTTDVEAQIDLTILKDIQKTSVTNLQLLGKLQSTIIFYYDDKSENYFNRIDVPFPKMSESFNYEFVNEFLQVFHGSYRKALERAVSKVDYREPY